MSELGASAALYPFALDAARDALMLLPMSEAQYRAASFLDERLGRRGSWTPAASVAQAMSGGRDVRPLHFIFHAGHVGSTLLSRLLDETGEVLPLREPLALRTIASDFSEPRLELLLKLWERGFESTRAVVLKATSATERLAATLLAMRPRSKAVLLNVSAESYIASLLAGENSAADLNAHGAERLHRLGKFVDRPPRPTTLGELAAMSWLAERLTQAEASRELGGRVLAIDFDSMLDALPQTLAQVLAHFGLSPEQAGRLADSAVLSRYSKAPEHAYSPALRRQLLAQARANYRAEIAAALAWIEALKIPPALL